MLKTHSWRLVSVVLLALVATACSGAGTSDDTIRVFAAASLTDAFAELEAAFEAANPGIDVELNLGGSSSLREQIRAGAPADVFASANIEIADSLVDEALITSGISIFATNSLSIAVPAGNPGAVTSAADLERSDLAVGLCAATAPCGELALEELAALGVEADIDTNEPDVRALLTKVELGELDVGVVYETDVLAADGGVEAIPLGNSSPLLTSYPIAALAEAPNSQGAQDFVSFVLSNEASAVLASFGFGEAA